VGSNTQRLVVTATTSAHNSERDEADEKLWDELRGKIEALVNDPEYAGITPMMF
jgi:hypothetical protein